jgi:hypothetical protein
MPPPPAFPPGLDIAVLSVESDSLKLVVLIGLPVSGPGQWYGMVHAVFGLKKILTQILAHLLHWGLFGTLTIQIYTLHRANSGFCSIMISHVLQISTIKHFPTIGGSQSVWCTPCT